MLGEYESHRAFPSDGLFRFGSPCGRQCSVLQINSWRHMPVPWACRDHVEQQPVVWPSFRQRGYLHVNLQARGRRRNRNEPGISVYRCGEAPRIEKKKCFRRVQSIVLMLPSAFFIPFLESRHYSCWFQDKMFFLHIVGTAAIPPVVRH